MIGAEIDLEWFWTAVKSADRIEVVEGLPHPMWETDSYYHELGRAQNFAIAGEHFYLAPLDVPTESREELRTGILSRSTFVIPRHGQLHSLRLCGGFHADYGLRFSQNGQVEASLLICFGCGELKLVGPKVVLTTDQTEVGAALFRSKFKDVRQSRPPSQSSSPAPRTPDFLEIRPPARLDLPAPPIELPPPPFPAPTASRR